MLVVGVGRVQGFEMDFVFQIGWWCGEVFCVDELVFVCMFCLVGVGVDLLDIVVLVFGECFGGSVVQFQEQ